MNGSAGRKWTPVSRVRDGYGGDPFGLRGGKKAGGRQRPSVVTLEALGLETKTAGWLASMLDISGGSYGGAEHLSRPFEEDGWVHVCLRTIASAVRSVPLRFWLTDPATDPDARQAPDSNEVVRLFAHPNPSMSPATFFEAGALHRKIDGDDFWLLYTTDGKPWDGMGTPSAMHPVRGAAVDVELDERGSPSAWRISVHGGKQQIFPAVSVVQFRDYDPNNPLRGLGDVEVLMRDLEMAFQAQRYMEAVLRNSGDPGGFIEIKGGVNREERDALEEEADQAFGPTNRGRYKVLEGEDVKYTPNSLSPKDMEFSELFQWVRDKTASVLGVPLPVIGVLENATYSNYQEAVRTFWKGGNGVVAYLRTVEDGINSLFLPRLRAAQGLIARFDTSQIDALQDDRDAKFESATKLKDKFPELSFNEAAGLVGLEIDDVEAGDVRLVPSTLATLESVLAAEVQAPPDPPQPAQEAAVLEERDADPDPEPEPQDAEAAALEEREAYWKAVDERVMQPGEEAVAKSYRKWSKSYEAAQIKRLESFAKNGKSAKSFEKTGDETFFSNQLTDTDIDVLLLGREEWAKKMGDALGPNIEDIFGVAASDMAAELGSLSIDLQDPAVLDVLARQVLQLSEGHTSTVANRVRSALLKTFGQSETTGTLQELVRDQLPELTESLRRVFGTREARALTIARTETAHASNGARFMQMRKSGVESHQWITSKDQRVRGTPGTAPTNHSHYELDGKEVPIGETFARKLKHPNDPEADAGDVINCRCITRAGKRTEEAL